VTQAGDAAHLAPVSISNGVVYSTAVSGFLVAWLEQTGTPLAELPLNGSALSGGVAIADGLVITNTGTQGSNGSVVAFAP
jgi:outer membrane protein assembly factor BamB